MSKKVDESWKRMLDQLNPGDTVVVASLDRICEDPEEQKRKVRELESKDVKLEIMDSDQE